MFRLALEISHFFAVLSFWMDLIGVLLARQRVGDYTDGEVSGHIGNALWLAFGAMVSCFSLQEPSGGHLSRHPHTVRCKHTPNL